jgi:hypothetical protein
VGKAFRVRTPGLAESCSALLDARLSKSVVHVVRREQAKPRVVMVAVVPGEKVSADAAGVLNRAETFGEAGPIFEGLEMRLGVGIVIGDVRS